MRRWSLILSAMAMLAVGLATTPRVSARPATLYNCRAHAYPENYVTSSRGIGCRVAAHEIRRSSQCCMARFRSAHGYHCRYLGTGPGGYLYRCHKGRRAFRFTNEENE